MKIALRSLLLICFMVPTTLFAADHQYNVRVDPLSFLFGSFNVGADIAVDDNWTVGGGLSYASLKSGSTKATVMGAEVRGQYFFDQVFTDSWYLAPYLTYSQGTGEDTGVTNVSINATTIGAIIGYMWIWDNFNMQLGGGIRHISISSDSNSSSFEVLSGVLPALEFNLGYAF